MDGLAESSGLQKIGLFEVDSAGLPVLAYRTGRHPADVAAGPNLLGQAHLD
jgi:hypothetical protein